MDEQKRTSTPTGPRLTKLEKMKRITTERKKVKSPTSDTVNKANETDPQRIVAALTARGGIKFDDDDEDEIFPTLVSSLGLIALPNNRNRAIHLAVNPFAMGAVSAFLS